jgi:4-hydroxy-4-methyl-2-oxoglutarate aldolase
VSTEPKQLSRLSETGGRASGLLDRLGRLYTAVVCDALDQLGLRQQAMQPRIRPLCPEARIVGRAVTVWTVPASPSATPSYDGEIAAVDSLVPGDVLVVSRCQAAFWGELLTTAAVRRGCAGVVVDGYTRDASRIIGMGFPCFVRGIDMRDSLGRIEVKAQNVPIRCGGVQVEPGDLILADFDGVIVVPISAAEAAISRAEEKVGREGLVRKELSQGLSVSDVFSRHEIL